jgi:hypothetical protein
VRKAVEAVHACWLRSSYYWIKEIIKEQKNMLALTFLSFYFLLQTGTAVTPSPASPVIGGFSWSEYLSNPFVAAIILSFAISSYILLRYLLKLPVQHTALKKVQTNYETVEKNQERDPNIVRNDLLNGVAPDSIAAQRVVELYRIGVRAGEFDQVALSEVLAAREASKLSIARYIASVLVLLGLCGAIWGLSGLILQMSPALNRVQEKLESSTNTAPQDGNGQVGHDKMLPVQESFKELINTMSASLANTRTAFYASLTGILTSVLLLLFSWYASRRQIEFLAAVEYLTATRLIPIFQPPREASELASALEAFKEGSNFLARLSGDLDNKVTQVGTSLENLFAIVRKFGDSSDALRSNQERVYQAQSQMIEVVQEFRDFMSRLENQQSTSGKKLEQVVTAISESNKNVDRALGEWRESQEKMLQTIQVNAERSSREAAAARETAQKGIDEIASLIQQSLENQVGAIKTQALEMLDKQQSNAQEHIDRMLERHEDFVSKLQESIASSDGHKELVSSMAKAMEDERSAFSERLENVLGRSDHALNALLAEQKKILDVSSMRNVEERLEEFVKSSRAEFSALIKRQENFDERFVGLGQQAGTLTLMLKILIGVAIVSIPVFAALGVMFIFDVRPEDPVMKVVSLLVIMVMIGLIAWFLRSKT